MTAMSKESVETLLEGVIDPHTGKGLVSGKSVNRIEINGDSLEIRHRFRLSGQKLGAGTAKTH